MKKTKNYAMPYPEQDDYFNVEDFQDMMVSVDDLMKKLSDSGAQISSDAEHLYNQTKAQMDNIQKRMNAFTELRDGSTTGDAELKDIRIAYDGKEYGNAGEAVREQASDIHKALFGAGASIWSKTKSESTKYIAETKGICILNERFTAAGVVAKISRGTFAQNESTLNLDRECSAYIVEFEKNPGTVYMPSAETIKIVSTTKIIFEANGNARCWIPVEKGQYLAVDSTATAYTSESNHVPYMLYDQANKTLECRGFGSTGSIEPVDPYSLALEYKLEYDMDDTGLVKQIDANREDAASLKEDLEQIDKIVLNEKMTPTELTEYGFTFNTIIGRKYIVHIPKTDGYKVVILYESESMLTKVLNLSDSSDNRNAKDTEFTATRTSYYIFYQAITANKTYSVTVTDEIGVFEYVRGNNEKLDELIELDINGLATKEDLENKIVDEEITNISAELLNGDCTKIPNISLRKEMNYTVYIKPSNNGWMSAKVVTKFDSNDSYSYQKGYLLGNAIQLIAGVEISFEIPQNNYVGFAIQGNNSSGTLSIRVTSKTETAKSFYNHSKNELINDYYSSRPTYACLGDSITSDQVTGIGTVVRKKLGLVDSGNYACGYATCSDWHDGDTNTTTQTIDIPQNTNTNDNVLSNQVRRLLQATTNEGETISWTHPIDGDFSIDPSVGVGTGTAKAPNIIYIAIGTNDGNNVQNTFSDDSEVVLAQSYSELTRNSYASSLRWAIETLQSAFHNAKIYVASPLQAYSTNLWMSLENTKAKRDCTEKIAKYCGVKFIDSFYGSGFSYLIAKADNGGGVHPSDEWKENIACFIAGQIESNYWTSKRYFVN
ncbi:SGNH/GDSL hydrolase family protein [Ruminococcus sp. OF02-6]|nr:SGNH/GDSL hydrolase family protein [Ruminococcus sp. OF02-6]